MRGSWIECLTRKLRYDIIQAIQKKMIRPAFGRVVERTSEMKKTLFAILSVVGGFAGYGDSRTVSDVAELYDAIDALNFKSSSIIYLNKGDYDLSGHSMNGKMTAHIAVTNLTFVGKTGNAEDVVVYGDQSQIVFFMRSGGLRHLTVSNGLEGVRAEGSGTIMTNVVAKCCSNPDGYGGGGYNGTWRCCTISGNSAKHGGGLYAGSAYDCLITGNMATQQGGGYHTPTLARNCIVSNNTAVHGGGGAKGTWTDCTLSGNSATQYGGGLYSCSATNCLVTGNQATNGGGCNAVTAYNCNIASNCANYGGGLYDGTAYKCQITFNDGNIIGGGTYSTPVYDSVIYANTIGKVNPDESYGKTICGGAGVYGGGTISNCTITGNAVLQRAINSKLGAGVYATTGTVLYACLVANNYSISMSSGQNGGRAVHCVFSNNVSSAGGYTLRQMSGIEDCDVYGGFCTSLGFATRCRFSGMTGLWTLTPEDCPHTNGTFDVGTSCTLFANGTHMTNCLVANNTVRYLFTAKAARQDAVNCTFADNHVTYFAMEVTSNGLTVVNSLFSGNTKLDGSELDKYFHSGTDYHTNVTIICSAFDKPVSTDAKRGPGGVRTNVYDVNADPKFANMRFDANNVEHPYSLKYRSPVRGLGDLLDWTDEDVDLRRTTDYPRVRDGKVDLGCYQCWLDPLGTTFLIR